MDPAGKVTAPTLADVVDSWLKQNQENGLLVLTGDASSMDPVESSFAFLKQIAGYDIIAFFERNTELLKNETTNMLEQLLSKGDY